MISDEAVQLLPWLARPKTDEDRVVVDRFLAGDRQAVATIDAWILRAAWPFQRRLRARWEDVLQEIRLEVTRLLAESRFQGGSSLKTYLFRVVTHTCVDQVRAQGRHEWQDLDALEDADQPRTKGPSPAEESAERDLLLRVLDQAPPECRHLWQMLAAGFSYKEMSGRMGVADGTLRVRVLRCREKATRARAQLLAPGPGNAGRLVAPKKSGGNANDLR